MRKIIVLSMITLDGVMQAPGGPEEDTSNGFKFGGWTRPYSDELYDKTVRKELEPAEYLLGRKTFEIWEDYWPNHADFWPGINQGMKYVFSNTRTESSWNNTQFIQTVEDVKNVKSTEGSDIHVWGSSELVHLLLAHDLVDEMRLKIHPLTFGSGKKLFSEGIFPAAFKLVESLVTTTGVILVHYRREGEVKTGAQWD
ncbi:dihydrofolate reductase family protein [Fulvivirga ligni]|uniref:dihydrofolate reductase family protein n=1 Tax=Fulvivirga ligni TaxID=2904246 RepID=UPI001F2EC259|nr:dihydrofolate reductase family protein [Fulvivirga ligni]UII20296.1 dihydrofolate reductase family protein [Fulvivirga ligni]